MAQWTIHTGDVADILPTLVGPFDAVLSDPPYGLAFMGREWDHAVPGPAVWRAVLDVMRPGASLLACGGTRTFHRLVCGVEDAGLEVRDLLIVWAMAPRDGSFAHNATEHGVAGINIEAGRVGTDLVATSPRSSRQHEDGRTIGGAWSGDVNTAPRSGRWPANVILDEAAATMLDEQTGKLSSGALSPAQQRNGGFAGAHIYGGTSERGGTYAFEANTGGASRFFYCAKASRVEREAGLHGFRADGPVFGDDGGTFQGLSNSNSKRANVHPTVKPIDLCRYLAAMLLPPPRDDDPRHILVPFSGSGSEMIGALLAGWDEVVGVELDPEYVAIAEARLAHWAEYRCATSDRAEAEAVGQATLFDLE